MKSIKIIFTLLCICLFAKGQTLQEMQNVIQQCIDLDSIQKFYSDEEFEGKKQLFIVDNGVLPKGIELYKYGNKVIFLSKEEMFFKNIKNHLNFSSFEMNSKKAKVVFQYGLRNSIYCIEFKKENDEWKVTKSKIEN